MFHVGADIKEHALALVLTLISRLKWKFKWKSEPPPLHCSLFSVIIICGSPEELLELKNGSKEADSSDLLFILIDLYKSVTSSFDPFSSQTSICPDFFLTFSSFVGLICFCGLTESITGLGLCFSITCFQRLADISCFSTSLALSLMVNVFFVATFIPTRKRLFADGFPHFSKTMQK